MVAVCLFDWLVVVGLVIGCCRLLPTGEGQWIIVGLCPTIYYEINSPVALFLCHCHAQNHLHTDLPTHPPTYIFMLHWYFYYRLFVKSSSLHLYLSSLSISTLESYITIVGRAFIIFLKCAWESYPRPQNGKRRRIHWTMAAHSLYKICHRGVAAIAPWECLRLPSCGPGFESQAHHQCYFQFVLLKL